MSRRFQVVLFLMFLSVLPLASQSFRGSIAGTITDSSGAAVPGAEVRIISAGTGLSRLAQTGDTGYFTVTELPPGNYDISATKSGFRTQTLRGVAVTVGSVSRANIALTPGQVEEKVEVTAAIPLIETSSNVMGGTIEGPAAVDMPVNGRDFTKLLVLVPGATGDPVGSTDSPGSFGLFSVNGNRGRSNNYMLDGTDMNDGYRNLPSINEAGVFGTPATILPVDALAEIPVLSGVEAEYGRNSGAVVNLVTKSGTNNLHGTLYGFLRDDRFDARNYFNASSEQQNSFHNDQFGASLGGPVAKDRTFFFLAYEGQREHGGLPTVGTVPTQADIAAAGGVSNPVIQNLLNRNPWGIALPATDGNVQFNTPFYNRVDSLIAKIDQHLGGHNKHNLLTGRYFFGDSKQSFPLGLVGGGGSAPGYNTVTPTRVNILSLSYTHIISPSFLLEFRTGWNRFHEDFLAQDINFDPRSIGLNTLVADANPRDFGLPLIQVGDFSSIGATPSVPRGRTDTNWQYFTNASWTKGSHSWKYGYEFRRTFVNGFFDAGYRGKLVFDTLTDFLQGVPTGGRSATGDSRRGTFQNNHGFYVQDNWRLTDRLTLNYGMRWDYYGVIGEEKGRFSILGPSGTLVKPTELYPKDYNNFGPRLSFAYDLTGSGKTVVRAGWGLFYDAFSQDFFVGQLPWNTFNPGPAYNDIGFVFSAGPIASALPVFTGYSAGDVFTVSQKMRTPYVQNFNLNVEQQLTKNIAAQIGYVGSAGRKLFRYRDINQVTNLATGDRPFPGLGYVNEFESTAASSYNSLQSSLRIRGWHGINSTLNYTWGHSIDNASDGQDYVPNAAQPDNSYNPSAERASSNFDNRHRLQWFWNYELPKFGAAPVLTSGWSVNGIVTYSTGQPYNLNFFDDFNGSGEFFGRPDVVGDPFAGGTKAPFQLLNLSAFAAPCTIVADACDPSTFHFGNLGRNAFNGPNYANFDFSLQKTTRIGERADLQFRVDFFNIFNHPNFSSPLLPNFSVDMFTNGSEIKTINGSQRMVGTGSLATVATPDVGTGNPFLGGGGPRNIQFGLRLSF
ncbi:MAG TPA: TonB-dependent receptor [Clostridia bacterium]|nr:TonB-dependent receptor [Clostridia bacterium]